MLSPVALLAALAIKVSKQHGDAEPGIEEAIKFLEVRILNLLHKTSIILDALLYNPAFSYSPALLLLLPLLLTVTNCSSA